MYAPDMMVMHTYACLCAHIPKKKCLILTVRIGRGSILFLSYNEKNGSDL